MKSYMMIIAAVAILLVSTTANAETLFLPEGIAICKYISVNKGECAEAVYAVPGSGVIKNEVRTFKAVNVNSVVTLFGKCYRVKTITANDITLVLCTMLP
jgi:hypothetical protein